MSKNNILSVDHNHLMNLSGRIKSNSEYFRDLSQDIKSIYSKLDWETASKGNVYAYVKKASESALKVHRFLNNASFEIRKISKDFNHADKDGANLVSKEASHIHKQIRNSGVKLASDNAIISFLNNIAKLFFGDGKNNSLPITSIPKNPKYSASAVNNAFSIPGIDFDFVKLGFNPLDFKKAPSNTINFWMSSVILGAITYAKRKGFKNQFRFSKYGASIIRYGVSDSVYYLITGKIDTLRRLEVALPRTKKFTLKVGDGVPDELLRRVRSGADDLKNGLRKANIDYIDKLKLFKRNNAQLLQDNPLLLKAKKLEFTVETLKELERSLEPLEAEMIRTRLKILEEAGDVSIRNILTDLNKNFRVQAVLKEIDPALLDELPRIDILQKSLARSLAFKAAGKEFVQELKLLNPWTMIKGIGAEASAIKNSGSFLKGASKFCKSSVILTAVGIGIDLAFDLTNGKNDDGTPKTASNYIADIVVDVGFGIAVAAASTMITSMIIGSAIGTCIPIPVVGTIVGAVVGIVVGLAIVLVTEVIKINGKSIKDWSKEAVSVAVDFGADLAKDVASFSVDAYNNATDAISSGWDGLTSSVSSGWNKLFGGGHKSQSSHSAAPKPQDYANQTTNLQPSYSSTSGTALTFGGNFQNKFAY